MLVASCKHVNNPSASIKVSKVLVRYDDLSIVSTKITVFLDVEP